MMPKLLSILELEEKENVPTLQNRLKDGYLPVDMAWGPFCNQKEASWKLIGIHSSTLASITAHIATSVKNTKRPSADYMTVQPDIDAKMRSILVDWLIDVSSKFNMLPQIIFMAVELIDRYLALKTVSHKKLQLVGVTALMIIGKYEEIYPPTLADYLAVCCNIYTAAELLEMEASILIAVGFSLVRPNPFFCLQLYTAAEELNPKTFAFCQYFLEVALLDLSHMLHDARELAAGAIYLARKLFKQPTWGARLQKITGIEEGQARSCAKSLFSILERVEHSNLKAAIRKYQTSKFFSISRYKIERMAPETPQHISYA